LWLVCVNWSMFQCCFWFWIWFASWILGFETEVKEKYFTILSAILHLGNVNFIGEEQVQFNAVIINFYILILV
jgi:hypothetical protein